MSGDLGYNGWTNYETWAVNLWIGNEEGSQRFWENEAKLHLHEKKLSHEKYLTPLEEARIDLARHLKEDHQEAMPEVQGVFADLLQSSLDRVNWDEIARHMIEGTE